jgi:hypothetical protein
MNPKQHGLRWLVSIGLLFVPVFIFTIAFLWVQLNGGAKTMGNGSAIETKVQPAETPSLISLEATLEVPTIVLVPSATPLPTLTAISIPETGAVPSATIELTVPQNDTGKLIYSDYDRLVQIETNPEGNFVAQNDIPIYLPFVIPNPSPTPLLNTDVAIASIGEFIFLPKHNLTIVQLPAMVGNRLLLQNIEENIPARALSALGFQDFETLPGSYYFGHTEDEQSIIVWSDFGGGLAWVNVVNGEVSSIPNVPTILEKNDLLFSPINNQLLIVEGINRSDLVTIHSLGSEKKLILRGQNIHLWSISPNSQKVLLSGQFGFEAENESVFVFDVYTQKLTQIRLPNGHTFTSNNRVAWSNDSNSLLLDLFGGESVDSTCAGLDEKAIPNQLWLYCRNTRLDVWKIDLQSQMWSSIGNGWGAVWSPSEQKVAYFRYQTGQTQIIVQNLNNGLETLLIGNVLSDRGNMYWLEK